MADPENKSSGRIWLRVALALVGLAALAAGVVVVKKLGLIEKSLEWMSSLGAWAPVIFVILYIAVVLVGLPGSILTAGGGILFGLFWGAVYVMIGAYGSAMLCFLISRHFARDWVSRKLKTHPKLRLLDEAVAREGWKVVLLVRLAPMFPLSITSYAFGLTRVPLWQYALIQFAMIPAATMYVYFGTLLGDVAGVRKAIAMPHWVRWTIAAVTLSVMIYVTRFATRALKQRMDKNTPA